MSCVAEVRVGEGGRGQLRSVSLASMCPVPPWLVVRASYDRAKVRYGGFWDRGIEKLPQVSLTSIIKVVEEGDLSCMNSRRQEQAQKVGPLAA